MCAIEPDISLLEASADTCSFCTGHYLDNLQGGWVPLVARVKTSTWVPRSASRRATSSM